MLSHQTPLPNADEYYLLETLVYCRVKLEAALRTAQNYNQLADLSLAIADTLTSCTKALDIVQNPKSNLE